MGLVALCHFKISRFAFVNIVQYISVHYKKKVHVIAQLVPEQGIHTLEGLQNAIGTDWSPNISFI